MNTELLTTDPNKIYIEVELNFEGVIVVKLKEGIQKILTIPKSEFEEEFKDMNEILTHGVEIKKTNGETV